MKLKALRKISLLSVIKLETKDFLFCFFVSDNLSAYFKTAMIYRMVNRNLKAVKPGFKRCTFVMRNIGLQKILSLRRKNINRI